MKKTSDPAPTKPSPKQERVRFDETGGEGQSWPFPWDPPRPKETPKLLKIPPNEATILKWLAGTIYSETETSIIQRAIRKELVSLLNQRGFDVDTDTQHRIISALTKPPYPR